MLDWLLMIVKVEVLEKKRILVMLGIGNDINVVDDRIKNVGILKGGDVLLIKLFDRKEGLVFVVFLNEDVELLN